MYFAEQALWELMRLLIAGNIADARMEETDAFHLLHVAPGPLNPAEPRVGTDVVLFSTLETGGLPEDDFDLVKLLCRLLESPAQAPREKIVELLNTVNRLLRFGCFYLERDGYVVFEAGIPLARGTPPLQAARELFYGYSNSLFMMKAACMPIRRLCANRLEPDEAGEMVEILVDTMSRK